MTCSCKRCKNKKFYNPYIVTMHLLYIYKKKKFMEKYLCWYTHRKLYVLYDTMVERMIGSTSNSNNVHEVVDNNSNSYKNMIMNRMKIN